MPTGAFAQAIRLVSRTALMAQLVGLIVSPEDESFKKPLRTASAMGTVPVSVIDEGARPPVTRLNPISDGRGHPRPTPPSALGIHRAPQGLEPPVARRSSRLHSTTVPT